MVQSLRTLSVMFLISIILACTWSGAVRGQVNFQMEVVLREETIELDGGSKETLHVSTSGTVKIETNEPGKLDVFLETTGGDATFQCDVEPTSMVFAASGSQEFKLDCTIFPPSGVVETQSGTIYVDARAVVGTVKPRTYYAEDDVLILVDRELRQDPDDRYNGINGSVGSGLMYLILTVMVIVLTMAGISYLAHRMLRKRRRGRKGV